MVAISKKSLYICTVIFFIGLVTAVIIRSKILIAVFAILFLISIVHMITVKIREKYLHPELHDILTKVISKFNEHDIKYWVDYGSLLGIIRDGDVIKHDYDTDICVHPDNINLEKKIFQIVNELGHPYYLEYNPFSIFIYRIRKRLPKPLDMFVQPYTDIYGIKLNNNMYEDATGKIPVEFVGETKKIEWNGLQVSVPEKIHDSLVWRYGENYRTPIIGKEAISHN
jgi:hypothetical protein